MHDEIDFAKIGQRIQKLRQDRKITQNKLAEICGCSSNHISAVENGTNRPSIELIIKISAVLNESVDYILMDAPLAPPKYIIDTQIAEKLSQCTAPTLQVVNTFLDSMLEYQKIVAKQTE